jgi:hypothetical protein
MLISLLNDDLLFSKLDPRHLGSLRLVNRAFAACINKDVRDRSVKAARVKYRQMIRLSEDTFRIHSVLGKTVIDLTLPTDVINEHLAAGLTMRFEGRLYHGIAMHWRCSMDGKDANMSPYVFNAKSPRLLKARGVFLARRGIEVGERGTYVRVVVEAMENENWGGGRNFTLHFQVAQ